MNDKVYLKIKENENLIYKIASKYSMFYNIDDLYQAGCIGIIKAYKKYDNSTNTKFSTYAYKYILGEIIDYIRKDKNIIISEELYSIYKKYSQIKELLCNKYECDVSFSDICKYMNIDENYMLSIIESVSVSNDISNVEYGFDNREKIDSEIMLNSELEKLNDYERNLINYRYYLGLSQEDTASLLGVNQVKVSRSEKLILKKIKSNIMC